MDGSTSLPLDPKENLTLGCTLKSLVRKCDVLFNTQPVCSETNLHNYWDIKQQEMWQGWEDECLDFPVRYNEDLGSGAEAGQSLDSFATTADIHTERTRRSYKLGGGDGGAAAPTGVLTNTTHSEKVQIFSLKDILIEDDNYIPSFMFDQASL